MAHTEKRLVWILAVGWLAFGSGFALAEDGPAPADAEADVVFSHSVGADRLLERSGSSGAWAEMSGNGSRILVVVVKRLWSGYELRDGETGRRLLHVRNTAPEPFTPNAAPVHHIFSFDMDERGRWFVTGGTLNFGYSPDLMRSTLVWRGSLVDAWDAKSGRLVRTFVLDNRQHMSWSAISRNGARIACVDSSLNAKVWDRETGREIAAVQGALPPDCEIDNHGVFSGDLKRFVVFARRKKDYRASIYLCDLSSKKNRLGRVDKSWRVREL